MNVFEESQKYFPSPFQELVFYDRYSRYNYDLGRRETWVETVDRAVDYLHELAGDVFPSDMYNDIRLAILKQEIMPSMRLLAMAGPAARRQNASIYNCSFMGVNNPICFGEAMLISMSGCGVGYSVERKHVDKLPRLPEELCMDDKVYTIEDTTEGWQDAINHHIDCLYNGCITKFDYSELRAAGTPLKTKGGVASGPNSLRDAIDSIYKIFLGAYTKDQERLTPLQVHDIMCAIGECSVAGGVRRSAMIALFDKDDKEMITSKDNGFEDNFRYNANNSAVFTDELTQHDLIHIMSAMYDGNNGEPGLFSRFNSQRMSPNRRISHLIEGTNPCGEINLRDMQFCNLTAAIARSGDTIDDLAGKVTLATVVGTIQSTAIHFPGLREQWSKNCAEERLLGVDITGQMDCPALDLGSITARETLRNVAKSVNRVAANALGIHQSVAITTCKPSGNTSALVDCASGIHPRYAPYYIRRIRINATSPVFQVLHASGFNYVPESGQTWQNITTAVFEFPMKAPEGAILRNDLTAIEHLEYWLENKKYWTEHNPSVTIYYGENEKLDIINWLWKHKNFIGGISFLPRENANYELPPYEEIDAITYHKLLAELPKIKWHLLEKFEHTDQTNAAQEKACSAGSCELV